MYVFKLYKLDVGGTLNNDFLKLSNVQVHILYIHQQTHFYFQRI